MKTVRDGCKLQPNSLSIKLSDLLKAIWMAGPTAPDATINLDSKRRHRSQDIYLWN